jgi:pimeloyl-ACP methyl ester carboxylesterase
LKEQFIEVDGCRVRVARDGKGAPLVFLHGANGPAIWGDFFERLSQRFEVIAPDHPAFGASADPAWLEDIGDLAYFYLDFFKALKLERIHLVGHSMGGWLAAEIAVRSTRDLATLTLAAAAGLRVPGHAGVDIFLLPPAELSGRHIYVDPKLSEAALKEVEAPKTPEQLDVLIRNRTAAAKLCWHPRLNNPQLARWLHRIDVPTHLVWGDSDHVIPPEHAKAYAGLIPGAKTTLIAKCGHSLAVEKPRETFEAIARFVEERS